MAISKQFIQTLFIVFLCFVWTVKSKSLSCYKEDFNDGIFGQFGKSCTNLSTQMFQMQSYNDSITGPDGSNDHYITTLDNGLPSCQEYSTALSLTMNSKLTLTVYLSTDESQIASLFIFGVDPKNPAIIRIFKEVIITGNSTWRNIEVPLLFDGDVLLRIHSEALTLKRGFLAIDSIEIGSHVILECINYCVNEDFSDGTLGQFESLCNGTDLNSFQIQSYDDSIVVPDNSNGYYMTPMDDILPSCQEYFKVLNITRSSRLILSVYLSTDNNQTTNLFIFGMDPINTTLVRFFNEYQLIGDKRWTTVDIPLLFDGEVLLRINCEALAPKQGFLAIDSIKIGSLFISDCEDSF
ncbi:uncharacterized protein LOC143910226 [Arctopsyche grandis]|uniref:uncharacterized protein LOC143910226 n=1 Tax=Arctopsyche grandis TaxID=121162 RepID=UPI00406D8BF5